MPPWDRHGRHSGRAHSGNLATPAYSISVTTVSFVWHVALSYPGSPAVYLRQSTRHDIVRLTFYMHLSRLTRCNDRCASHKRELAPPSPSQPHSLYPSLLWRFIFQVSDSRWSDTQLTDLSGTWARRCQSDGFIQNRTDIYPCPHAPWCLWCSNPTPDMATCQGFTTG